MGQLHHHQPVTPMKTLISTFVVVVIGVASAYAGQPQTNQADCAKTMCQNMRNCSQQFDGVEKPNGKSPWLNSGNTTSKKTDQAQGYSSSCFALTYDSYLGCFGNVVKKPSSGAPEKTVKTATPSSTNK